MDFFSGDDRILYIKKNGYWLPIACLTSNSLSETTEMLPTTTRDNNGWQTSRPVMQNYNIAFDGLQVNTSIAGGNFSVASYDTLKLLKRSKTLLDWKIEGTLFPVVDYGKGYITDISESSAVGEFLSFSGSIVGFGIPLTKGKGEFVLNNGDPEIILTTSEAADLIIRTSDAY
jgi:hypothetical protein